MILMTDEQKKQFEQAWIYSVTQVSDYLEQMVAVMKKWFPVISSAHRETVRAVHTAYRRKQKARQRRNRKR